MIGVQTCALPIYSLNHPFMVSVRNANKNQAQGNWTNLSNYTTILNGNDYYQVGLSPLWWSAKMTEWLFSKIESNSNKMTIPFIPGNVSSDNQALYIFYSTIVAGARGVIWWMDNCSTEEKTNYTYQKAVYSNFLSNRVFHPDFDAKSNDRDFILDGEEKDVWWSNRETLGTYFDNGNSHYPILTSNRMDATGFKYENRWRLFVVNHTNSPSTFTCGIDDSNIYGNPRAWEDRKSVV